MSPDNYNLIPDELTEQELELLFSLATERKYSDGEVIFLENSIAESMFIISHGRVSVVKELDGELETLANLGRGEFLGEMALLGNKHRNATARAEGSALLYEVSKEMFSSLLENDKLLADKLIKSNDTRGTG